MGGGAGEGTRVLLRGALRHSAGRCTALALVSMGATGAGLALPAVLGRALDLLLAGAPAGRWVGWCVALTVVTVVLDGCASVLTGTVDGRTAAFLRRGVVRHVLALGPRGPFEPGDLVARIVGSGAQAGTSPSARAALVAACAGPLGGIVALGVLDLWLAVVFLAGAPLLALLLRVLARDTSACVVQYQNVQGRIAAALSEAVDGARTIRAAGTAERDAARVLRPLPELSEAGRRMWRVQGRAAAQAVAVAPLLQLGVVAVAGLLLARHRLSPGDVLAASRYAVLATGVGVLTGQLAGLVRARAAARRLAEVHIEEAPAHGTLRLPPGPGRLELRGVRGVRGDRTVLDGIDLVVPGGTTLAVVGRSGSGKSLLAALAARLADPSEGEILLDGVPLRDLSRTELRSAIACAFDRPVLLGATIQDTIMLGMGAREGGSAGGGVLLWPAGSGACRRGGPASGQGASAGEGTLPLRTALSDEGVADHHRGPASGPGAPPEQGARAEERASAREAVLPRQTPLSVKPVPPRQGTPSSGQDAPSGQAAASPDAVSSPDKPSLRQAAEAAARKAHAHPFVTRLPHGYDTACADAPHSGGEAQRLGLARAFARPARLLVLDDALSSLDTVTEHRITDALFSPSTPTTRLLITHRATTAARADAVAWVEDGRIRAMGTHAELWGVAGYRGLFGEGGGGEAGAEARADGREGAAGDRETHAGGDSRPRSGGRAEGDAEGGLDTAARAGRRAKVAGGRDARTGGGSRLPTGSHAEDGPEAQAGQSADAAGDKRTRAEDRSAPRTGARAEGHAGGRASTAAGSKQARAGGDSRPRTGARASATAQDDAEVGAGEGVHARAVPAAGSARGGAAGSADTRAGAVSGAPQGEGDRPARRDAGGRVGGARGGPAAVEDPAAVEPSVPGRDRKGLR